ncbi:response regulator [Paenibacillus sp. M1]|uniref:Response regulator n=1 Tax=Paenibacillus haidiansis TaxID=1574488 RepID=A0ABU7VRN1_9BACL
MLRIAIVDDETTIREGLAKMIGKESDRFFIAGTFANGQEALDFIDTSEIDVVVTDIRMPLVDGLELIGELKRRRPDIRCIIMSGFTDFEYARQALRYSAVDYLLKPINKKQLFSLLHDLEQEREASLGKRRQLRSGLLVSYLKSEPSLCPKLPELTLPLPCFAVMVLKGSDTEALRSSVGLLHRQPDNRFDTVDTGDTGIVLVCYYENPPEPGDIAALADRLRQFPHPGIVQVGASPGYGDPASLSRAYAEAKRACDRGMYGSESWSCHIYNREDFGQEPQVVELFSGAREGLIQPMQVLNLQQSSHRLELLFDELRQVRASRESLLLLCRLVMEAPGAELPEWGKIFDSAYMKQMEEELAACLTFDELKDRFLDEFSKALQQIRSARLGQGGKSVEIVKKWIAEHYDQPAELVHLASMVYLTPSYLSKLFKHETGMTITDYMIEIRIKRAKQLLTHSNEMKIHEVGSEVGYPDPAYFNKLFKRVVGITPNEYKKISQSS